MDEFISDNSVTVSLVRHTCLLYLDIHKCTRNLAYSCRNCRQSEHPVVQCSVCSVQCTIHSLSYWSPRLASSHYCQQLTLSVCLSGCLSRCFKLLLFCFSMESSHFWPSFPHVALYKTLFFNFWFRPPNAQNLLPKICTKSPISQLVWQIDWRCWAYRGFSGMADSMEPCKMWGQT